VQGAGSEDVARFFDLPFAAPPVGALRFRAPQDPALRDAVRDAQALGPGCIQVAGASPFGAAPARQSEDCLQLNIWRPAGEGPHPAMVWIHGGGSVFGSAVDEIGGRLSYDGEAFARSGIVFVSINYRLNAFGFLSMRAFAGEAPDQPSAGNYGLLDQIAALRWVRGNIAAFAGDPGNVTVFGESAGGVSVCNLLASPLAGGLFAKAIMQSGNCLRNPTAPTAAFAQGDRGVAAAGSPMPRRNRPTVRP
jgi:para-nitrobenzyl esterase